MVGSHSKLAKNLSGVTRQISKKKKYSHSLAPTFAIHYYTSIVFDYIQPPRKKTTLTAPSQGLIRERTGFSNSSKSKVSPSLPNFHLQKP